MNSRIILLLFFSSVLFDFGSGTLDKQNNLHKPDNESENDALSPTIYNSQQHIVNLKSIKNDTPLDFLQNKGENDKKMHDKKTWITKLQQALEMLNKEVLEEEAAKEEELQQQLIDIAESNGENGTNDNETSLESNQFSETENENTLESCIMLNRKDGFCQPTAHCMMQEPEQDKFTVCMWGKKDIAPINGDKRSPPEQLCCPRITIPIEQLKTQFEQWTEKAKNELFAAGLPKNPNGICGMIRVDPLSELETRMANDTSPDIFVKNKETPEKQEIDLRKKSNKVRIVLGRNARAGQIPWMVSIYHREQFICGGSIITERHILTAAHCMSAGPNPLEYTVRYGSVRMYNGTQNRVISFVVHDDYNPPGIYNDIALLKLEKKIKINKWVQPVCLPGKRMYGELMIGLEGSVAGFGDLAFGGPQTSNLQEVDVVIINNTYCDQNYRTLAESGKKFKYGIGKTLICAGHEDGHKDACQGDSGGPLTVNYRGANYQIGIVSFGYRCALPKFPGVYTCVSHFLKWIFENLEI